MEVLISGGYYMNPIEQNAFKLLVIMVENEKDQYDNELLKTKSSLSPQDLNDAVDYLESLGAIDAIRELGTQPFDFSVVLMKSRGRYLYHEIKETIKTEGTEKGGSNIMLPEKPLNPVGSPFGFTDDDWVEVVLGKKDSTTLYVVVGMQFNSDFYKTEKLLNNVKEIFSNAIDEFNKKNTGNKVELNFEQLDAGYGEHLFNKIARNIIRADIAVFETSDLNPNVMLEMGVALTWGTMVLPIKKKGRPNPPSDISGQTWVEYDNHGLTICDVRFDNKIIQMIERAMGKKKKE
jgi:hypothetical protein